MAEEKETTPEEDARIWEENFGVSPEERARIDAKLRAALADIRAGTERPYSLAGTIHEFGEERFTEALPEITSYLTSTNERLRYMALHVLTYHFQLKDYKYAAVNMLQHDPDEECRQQAASGLGVLMKNTGDHESLHALAQAMHNEEEDDLLHLSAYRSMRRIVHDDRKEQNELDYDRFVASDIVDWEFVDSYL
ncbi:MAG TPA: HEAT repeat domain-containing protein [Ktedonobacteraceae bacterium]|jgi:hypothetical protein|nr:HEAT repeat domain-containing protein [Ktedonobacteraceae bacterium]